MKIRNERGFSPVIIVAIIAVVALIGGGAFYFLTKEDKKDTGNTPDTSQSINGTESCNQALNDENFCRFVGSWNASASITTTITSPAEGSVMTIQSKGDNSHSTITAANGTKNEIIILDGVSYMKLADAESWTKFGDAGSATPTDDYTPNIDFSNEETKSNLSVQSLGEEACGELTCYKYQIIDASDPNTTTIVWFDTEDFKARRMTTQTAEGTAELTFSYEEVTITEPSPIVEAPNFEGMSAEEIETQL